MKILSLLTKFEVGISFIPFILIILYGGYYKLFFTYFLITFIHELGHVFMAMIFKIETKSIKLSMFGFSACIEDYKYISFYKQLLILLAGPLTFFISNLLIKNLYLYDVISLVTYHKALLTNKYIFIFNLLPIFPLDGGRIIKLFLDRIFTFKVSKKITIYVSFIFTLAFMMYSSANKQYLMYIFLLVNFILNILFLKKEWRAFLYERYFFNNKYNEKLHSKKDLYMHKNNYLIYKHNILNEKESIIKLLRN